MNKIQMMKANASVQVLKGVSDLQSVLLKMMIERMNGKFFSATVVTKKGVRKFNATTNIKKFNKGIVKRASKDNLVVVYDNYARGVRTIDLTNLKNLKCGKVLFEES